MRKNVCVFMNHPKYSDLFLGVSLKKDRNSFGLPGGKIEPDENYWKAARRESWEETGLRPAKLKKFYDDGLTITFYYSPSALEIQRIENQPNEGCVGWITKDRLLNGPYGAYNAELFKKIKLEE
jgi:8-oxo-dGTP pyrophosphatase MutT (NUDIX family)